MLIYWLATPMMAVAALYIAAALLPAVFLLRYIYKQDTVEKEPPALLGRLLIMGVLAALCAGAAESLLEPLLQRLINPNRPLYVIVLAFAIVGVAEEGAKFFFLKRCTWNDPNFNFRFDAMVYSVFVSLGFAAVENIRYVLSFGLSVALPRALFAIPGHMCFAVFMGLFYGRAKLCEGLGDVWGERENLRRAYLAAVLLHGFYDACAMLNTTVSMVVFLIFVFLMYRRAFRLIRQESATDAPV